jgi:hypothetical protein
LNRFSTPLACISTPSSTVWSVRFGLLTMGHCTCMLYSWVLIFFFMIVCLQ